MNATNWLVRTLILAVILLTACSRGAETPVAAPDGLWEGWAYDGTYTIQVDQPRALLDTPITIRLTGFQPGQPVTLRARMGLQGRTLESCATFAADGNGAVDVGSAAPLYGTYTQADGMGLLWSMRPIEAETSATGSTAQGAIDPLQVTLTAEAGEQVLASATIERLFYDETQVTRQEVEHEGLVATLFVPSGAGPHPAIVWLGGSEGGLREGTAALLASHGYAALALAYFGVDPLPGELIEIPLEYCKEGIDWLKAQPAVGAQHVAVLGGSKGAELALLLAATYPEDIQAVVAYKPSAVVWMGVPRNPQDSFRGPKSSWAQSGQALPFVNGTFTFELIKIMAGRPAALVSSYEGGLKDEAAVAAATIPVENIGGPVLLLSGADDQMWPSARMGEMVMRRLDEHGFGFRHEPLIYEGVGHGINYPYTPTTLLNTGSFLQGGTPEGTAAANADSWPKVLEFLEEALR